MAGLNEIKSRIQSVNSTIQITSAMKMVSAAKLKRAQDAILQTRPYAAKLKEILEGLTASLEGGEGVYGQEREANKVLIIAITSNRGLCGGFNNQVIKATHKLIKEQYADSDVQLLALGKKARDAFKRTEYAVKPEWFDKEYDELYNDLTFDNVSEVAERVMELFREGEVDRVVLMYNRFKNAATSLMTQEQYLPVQPDSSEDKEFNMGNVDYIFEPSKKEMLDEIIPKSLKIQLFKAMLDSVAAEHGARMTAMHKATDNANDLVKELRLYYNKERQAAITGEILEIVGGAEALNS